jgi:hypothetical protein
MPLSCALLFAQGRWRKNEKLPPRRAPADLPLGFLIYATRANTAKQATPVLYCN